MGVIRTTRLLMCLGAAGCFWVSPSEQAEVWDRDRDGIERPLDCDDGDPNVGALVWYVDADGDGYGNPQVQQDVCDPPEGWVADGSDCDDGDAAIHPSATEVCNGRDDDCDGEADDGIAVPTWFEDGDLDTYGDPETPTSACEAPPGTVGNGDDCDDGDAKINPAAVEVCNTVDDDCDGDVDLDDADMDVSEHTWFFDGDLDTWGTDELTAVACEGPAEFVDRGGDCDDGNAAIHPGATEVCNGDDDDCDTVVDPYGSVGGTTYYVDNDGDGFGDVASPIVACEAPPSAATVPFDCDDADPCTNPAAVEVCDGNDNDCDLTPDNNCVPVPTGDTGLGCL